MSDTEDFSALERVVGDDLRFRLKLGIGEDAYRAIRYGKALQRLWDVGGVAATGAAAAASPLVASTFFGGSGILGLIGLGTASTPIGWVIAAAAASAGAYYGVLRLVGNYGDKRVRKVPEFINSPIDLLGATLVDMIGTLAVKLGAQDGPLPPGMRQRIIGYFVTQWGIDAEYAPKAITLIAQNAAQIGLGDAARELGRFLRENEDCNAVAIRSDILAMLSDLLRADGAFDAARAAALEQVAALLRAETDPSLRRAAGTMIGGVAGGIGAGLGALGQKLRRRRSAPRRDE